MLKAEIRTYTGGKEQLAAVVSYNADTGIAVETENDVLRRMLSQELPGRHGKKVSLHDGEAFVRELPFVFKSAYARAEIVEDEETNGTLSEAPG